MKWLRVLLVSSLMLSLACGDDPPPEFDDGDFPTSSYDDLFEGVPDRETLSEEGKADDIYPSAFDLVDTQSPVKSQGRRGVCSIFSTTALMEHLFITEGTITEPDFSEQFLQWSAKVEVGSFPHSGGSNASSNLRALNRFGTVEEPDWVYEPTGWNASNDPDCGAEEESDRPTLCFTNGEPPMSALMARRWKLPQAGRYIRPSVTSIKAHMTSTNTAVIAGMDFFYQAWGHGGSSLPTYAPHKTEGVILNPNAEDVRVSLEKRAGHSILIVGWNDDKEFQSVNEAGEGIVDEDGEPVMQTGFFLIKNSWGDTWATGNEFGAGYGWISFDYIEEHANVYGSRPPRSVDLTETCGDMRDNDGNGDTDCDDEACAAHATCMTTMDAVTTDTLSPSAGIPDNNEAGLESTITVDEGGTIADLVVDLDITHPYSGDVVVTLQKDGVTATLVSNEGGSDDDIVQSFTVNEFIGTDAAGDWTLKVIDTGAADEGTLNSWTLRVTRCEGDMCEGMSGGMSTNRYENDSLVIIEDGGDTVTSSVNATQAGLVAGLAVEVDITHPFVADLVISLEHDGEEVEIAREIYTTNLNRTFTLDDFNGADAEGEWTLKIRDVATGDEGTLNSFALSVTTR